MKERVPSQAQQASEDLEPRKRTLLRAVVLEYVDTAEPIASEYLVEKYDLGIKSATVRNELSEMAELGFLEQPHTSAGRIPSDKGYRYFVDHLLVPVDLRGAHRQTINDAQRGGEALFELLNEATLALSRWTQLLSVAAILRDADVRLKNVIVSAVGPHQALLVVVLGNGHVESRMVECPPGLTLTDLGQVNEALQQSAVGESLKSLARSKVGAGTGKSSVEKLELAIRSTLRSIAKDLTRGRLVSKGEELLLAQPEFKRDSDMISELIETLQSTDLVYDALSAGSESIESVTIGKENRRSELSRLSIVRQVFFVGGKEAGVIGIVGPTRMAYESGLPLVNYTARALSDALTKFFA